MKNREQIKELLRQTGRWKSFVERREQLKKEGHAPVKAFEIAWKEIQEQAIKAPWTKSGASEPSSSSSTATAQPPATATSTQPSVQPLPPLASLMPLPLPPLPTTSPSRASRPKKQKPNVGDDADWVYVTLPVYMEAVRHQRPAPEFDTPPPSPGALGLLTWAAGNANTFYDMYLARRLPNRTAIDNEDKKHESGRSVMELARELLNAINDEDPDFSPDGPQDDAGESGVPDEDDGEGAA